jgi:hypothetical protein
MAKNAFNSTNIFNITNPETYRCQVLQYHAKLSRLTICVFKDQPDAPAFYLLFTDVGYMDCPMAWQGAEFNIGSQDACIELMLEVGLIGQAILRFPNAYASITEYARLYEIKTAHKVGRLIASSGTLLNQKPD